MSAPKLSAVLITRNEERRLGACISALSWADEIIVIDAMSDDATADIARSFNAVVHRRAFTGFSDQRNFGIEKSSHEWILMIDADEEVTDDLRREIQAVLGGARAAQAYAIPRRNIVFGKFLRFGGNYPDYQVRLFLRDKGRFVGKIHERLAVEGAVRRLKNPLIHRSTAGLNEYLSKLIHYTDWEVEELRLANESAGWGKLFLAPSTRFIWTYFAKAGFLDGFAGLLTSLFGSFYVFIKYLKLRESRRRY